MPSTETLEAYLFRRNFAIFCAIAFLMVSLPAVYHSLDAGRFVLLLVGCSLGAEAVSWGLCSVPPGHPTYTNAIKAPLPWGAVAVVRLFQAIPSAADWAFAVLRGGATAQVGTRARGGPAAAGTATDGEGPSAAAASDDDEAAVRPRLALETLSVDGRTPLIIECRLSFSGFSRMQPEERQNFRTRYERVRYLIFNDTITFEYRKRESCLLRLVTPNKNNDAGSAAPAASEAGPYNLCMFPRLGAPGQVIDVLIRLGDEILKFETEGVVTSVEWDDSSIRMSKLRTKNAAALQGGGPRQNNPYPTPNKIEICRVKRTRGDAERAAAERQGDAA